MNIKERILNLVVLFLLFVVKTGYEFYLNKAPFYKMLKLQVFIGPIIFVVSLWLLGAVFDWIKEENQNEKTMSINGEDTVSIEELDKK